MEPDQSGHWAAIAERCKAEVHVVPFTIMCYRFIRRSCPMPFTLIILQLAHSRNEQTLGLQVTCHFRGLLGLRCLNSGRFQAARAFVCHCE